MSEGGADHIIYRLDRGPPDIFRVIAVEDELTEYSVGFTRDGKTLYRVSSAGRDKAALLAIDWQTGEQRGVAEHPATDINGAFSIVHPETFVMDAASAEHLEHQWIPLNAAIAADLDHLQAALPGSVRNIGRTVDDRCWIVTASAANLPPIYYLYERETGTVTELFARRPEFGILFSGARPGANRPLTRRP